MLGSKLTIQNWFSSVFKTQVSSFFKVQWWLKIEQLYMEVNTVRTELTQSHSTWYIMIDLLLPLSEQYDGDIAQYVGHPPVPQQTTG